MRILYIDKRTAHQGDITIFDIYAVNIGILNYTHTCMNKEHKIPAQTARNHSKKHEKLKMS